MIHAYSIRQTLVEPAAHPAPGQATAIQSLGKSRKFAQKATKIALPTMEGLCFEKVKNIAYLEANGNYTALHFKDKRQILVCKTLREVEQLLPEHSFVRIHRSHTIHLKHLKKYVRGKGGHVILQNGTSLTVSAGQKEAFLHQVKRFFA